MQTVSGTMPMILSDVTIRLADRPLLAIAATVMPGAVLTVMGPSGSGKSSLLAYIGGFLDPAFKACGSVTIGDTTLTDLPAHERRTGILFQDALLFPHLSVGANIALAIPQAVKGRRVRRDIAEAALDEVGLDGFFDRDPDTLSGGQKARVALQRVLASRPRCLLLDEPFSKLDAALREQVRSLVFAKAKAAGIPAILVTHDPADAAAAGGAIIEIGAEART